MRMRGLSLLVAVGLSGCAGTMIDGKLFAIDAAETMDFQIERSRGTGTMSAYSPKSGETFSGQYTAVFKGGGMAFSQGGGQLNSSTFSRGSMIQTQGSFTSSGTTFIPPTGATARGVLMGDKGTVIEIYMDIRPGLNPKGHGEGIDNNGLRYQVQF